MYRVTALSRAAVVACLAASVSFLSNQTARAQGPDRSWTGFYAGIHGGKAWGEFNTVSPSTPDQDSSGGIYGAQIGYNWQSGFFVVGVEVDASLGDVNSRTLDGNFITETTSIEAFGTLRGRAGIALGRVMPYITGGLAWAHLDATQSCPANATAGFCLTNGGFTGTDSGFRTGWTAGIGVEALVTNQFTLKLEYLRADFGDDTWNFGTTPKGNPTGLTKHDFTMDVVRIGGNYRF
jgi:outer membrane immunogenic protein